MQKDPVYCKSRRLTCNPEPILAKLAMMKQMNRFTLVRHDGPYTSRPTRSMLLLDGEPTTVSLPGYELRHQFETPDGYVFVTDFDCPFEEITSFILVNKTLSRQSCRWILCPLPRVEWIDERNFVALINDEHRYLFTIRSWWIPYVRPRLRMKRLPQGII